MTTGSRTEGVRGIGSNGFIRTVGNLTVTGDLVVLGENRALAGTGSFFWEDADSNAEYWAFELPSGTSEHVPVLGVGVGLDGVDLGLFDGITFPTMAVLDADRDSFIAIDHSADDAARLRSNTPLTIESGGAFYLRTSSGEDINLVFGGAFRFRDLADSEAVRLTISNEGDTVTFAQACTWATSAGQLTINSASNFGLHALSGFAILSSSGGNSLHLQCGDAFNFSDKDDGDAVRVTIASATGAIAIGGGASNTADIGAVADQVGIFRHEIGAGNTVLGISQETAVATETDETKFSHKMQVRINGATYFLMLTAT